MQKVHLWMDCSKRILWSWTQSIATKIRAATVQSSVWTLQQILSDIYYYTTFCKLRTSSFTNRFFQAAKKPDTLKYPTCVYAYFIAVQLLLSAVMLS